MITFILDNLNAEKYDSQLKTKIIKKYLLIKIQFISIIKSNKKESDVKRMFYLLVLRINNIMASKNKCPFSYSNLCKENNVKL